MDAELINGVDLTAVREGAESMHEGEATLF
jgi:hypothetical protein